MSPFTASLSFLVGILVAGAVFLGAHELTPPHQPTPPVVEDNISPILVGPDEYIALDTSSDLPDQPYPLPLNVGATNANSIETTVALFETTLANGISSSATTMTLTSATTKDGTTLASSTYAFIIDEGSASQEFVRADCTATACTNIERGISVLTGTTSVTALMKKHNRGASVKITTGPSLIELTNIINGRQSIRSSILFDSIASYTSAPSFTVGSNQLASVKYAQDYANAVIAGGAPTSSATVGGKVLIATKAQIASSTDLGVLAPTVIHSRDATTTFLMATTSVVATRSDGKISPQGIATSSAETYNWGALHIFNGGFVAAASSTFSGVSWINATTTAATSTPTINFKPQFFIVAADTFTGATTPQPYYIASSTNASAGKALRSDADAIDAEKFDGFAISNAQSGGNVLVQTSGVVSGFTGLTAGADYFVQNAVGTIGTTVGTSEQYVGTAISTTAILMPRNERGMQYLGSQALNTSGATVISQPLARMAVISVNATATNCSGTGDVVIYKTGKVSASFDEMSNVGATINCQSGYTWDAAGTISNSVSGTGGSAQSATAYYYR